MACARFVSPAAALRCWCRGALVVGALAAAAWYLSRRASNREGEQGGGKATAEAAAHDAGGSETPGSPAAERPAAEVPELQAAPVRVTRRAPDALVSPGAGGIGTELDPGGLTPAPPRASSANSPGPPSPNRLRRQQPSITKAAGGGDSRASSDLGFADSTEAAGSPPQSRVSELREMFESPAAQEGLTSHNEKRRQAVGEELQQHSAPDDPQRRAQTPGSSAVHELALMSQGEYKGTEPEIVIVKKQAQKATRRAPAVALPLPDPLPDDQFPTKFKGETIAVPAPGESAGDTQSKGRRVWQERQQRGVVCDELPAQTQTETHGEEAKAVENGGAEPAIVIVKKQAQKATRRAPAVTLPLPDPPPDDQFPTKFKGETIAVPAPGESAGDTQSKGRRVWQERQQRGVVCDELPAQTQTETHGEEAKAVENGGAEPAIVIVKKQAQKATRRAPAVTLPLPDEAKTVENGGAEPEIVIVKEQAQKATRRAPAVALPLPDPLPDDQFPTKFKGEAIAVPAPGESAGDTQSKGRREEEATVCRKREAEAAAEVVAAAEAEARKKAEAARGEEERKRLASQKAEKDRVAAEAAVRKKAEEEKKKKDEEVRREAEAKQERERTEEVSAEDECKGREEVTQDTAGAKGDVGAQQDKWDDSYFASLNALPPSPSTPPPKRVAAYSCHSTPSASLPATPALHVSTPVGMNTNNLEKVWDDSFFAEVLDNEEQFGENNACRSESPRQTDTMSSSYYTPKKSLEGRGAASVKRSAGKMRATKMEKGSLGVRIRDVKVNGTSRVQVYSVTTGGLVWRQGDVKEGDLLVSLNGTAIRDCDHVNEIVAAASREGTGLVLQYQRSATVLDLFSRSPHTYTVTLYKPPAHSPCLSGAISVASSSPMLSSSTTSSSPAAGPSPEAYVCGVTPGTRGTSTILLRSPVNASSATEPSPDRALVPDVMIFHDADLTRLLDDGI